MSTFCKHRVLDKCKKDGKPCFFSEGCFEPEEPIVFTNADRIRAMSDEELVEFINRCASGDGVPKFCRNLQECDDDMERDTLIPLERCDGCLLYWLQQPAPEEGEQV